MAPTDDPRPEIVFFDIDDTMYSTTAFSDRARRNAVGAMVAAGLDISVEEALTELGEVVAEFSSNYPEHFSRLLDRLGPPALAGRNPAVLVAAGVVGYHRTKERGMRLLPDVEDALTRLAGSGQRLGVISAGLRVKQAEKLVRLDALRFFDPRAIFFSDQMGVSKPNPKLFTKACEAAGVSPEGSVYVGDRPDHDIVPAKGLGMRTVLYTGAHGKYCKVDASATPDHVLEDLRPLPGLLGL